MTFLEYVKAQRANLDSALRFELYAVACPLMHELYEMSVKSVPKDVSPNHGQFLLICHKSFLAAAILIGQAQPDDAGPITRRAIEVVRVAAAIKDDPKFSKAWVAYDQRLQRWRDRDTGKKPTPLHIPVPVKHPLVNELMDTWGIISDLDVHFTPEYLHTLRWEKTEDQIRLQYFTGQQHTIETAIVQVIGTHKMILAVLNDCLDGALSANQDWRRLSDELIDKVKPWADKVGAHGAEFE